MTPTFDDIVPRVRHVLETHRDDLAVVKPLVVNRDLNGRVRLIVPARLRSSEQAVAVLDSLAAALEGALGPHGYPAPSAFLFEEDPEAVSMDAPGFPLEGFVDVRVVDRLALESDWASVAPIISRAPRRIVFYSIKGGVGRSTALAASAWALAQAGKRVLVLDLDLESPGLSSALLPPDRRPSFGIVDWLVEDLVDNAEPLLHEMVATSGLAHDGEIYVVPAHGRDPGEYIAKLGRVWMAKRNDPHRPEGWVTRLSRLIGLLEDQHNPDVVLIDARAGIDEIAAASIVGLGADPVLLFATADEQSWSGYRILLQHWRTAGVAETIRERLQVVAAMVPEVDSVEYVQATREQSYELFLDEMYDEVAPGDTAGRLWSFAESDASAPHYPCTVRWHRMFSGLRSLRGSLDDMESRDIELVFGSLIASLARLAGPVGDTNV